MPSSGQFNSRVRDATAPDLADALRRSSRLGPQEREPGLQTLSRRDFDSRLGLAFCNCMPSITRVEFSVGPSLRSHRAVLLIEIPDEVLQQIRKGKTSSEVEGYRVALEAIRALHLGSVRGDMTFLSSTPGKIKKPESLSEPHYTAGDGCRAWVLKTP
jgi:hypothetical protein